MPGGSGPGAAGPGALRRCPGGQRTQRGRPAGRWGCARLLPPRPGAPAGRDPLSAGSAFRGTRRRRRLRAGAPRRSGGGAGGSGRGWDGGPRRPDGCSGAAAESRCSRCLLALAGGGHRAADPRQGWGAGPPPPRAGPRPSPSGEQPAEQESVLGVTLRSPAGAGGAAGALAHMGLGRFPCAGLRAGAPGAASEQPRASLGGRRAGGGAGSGAAGGDAARRARALRGAELSPAPAPQRWCRWDAGLLAAQGGVSRGTETVREQEARSLGRCLPAWHGAEGTQLLVNPSGEESVQVPAQVRASAARAAQAGCHPPGAVCRCGEGRGGPPPRSELRALRRVTTCCAAVGKWWVRGAGLPAAPLGFNPGRDLAAESGE